MADTAAETNGTKPTEESVDPTELEQKIIRQVEVTVLY